MKKDTLKTIEELKNLKKEIKTYKNQKQAINYLVEKTKLSEKECESIYDFLIGSKTDKENKNTTNNVFKTILFYCVVSLTGIVVLPTLGIIAPVFILCAFICPIVGIIHFISGIFGFDLPFVSFQFGNMTLNPFLGLVVGIIIGVILYFIGKGSWKLLLLYINKIKEKKESLGI